MGNILWRMGRPFITGVDKSIESIQSGRDVILSGNNAYSVIKKKKIPVLDKDGDKIKGKFDGYTLTLQSKNGNRTEKRTFKEHDLVKAVDAKSGEGINGWKIAGAATLGLGAAAYAYHTYKKTKAQLAEEDKKIQQLQALTSVRNPRGVSTTAITDARPLSNNVGYQQLSPANVYASRTASTAIGR